MKVLARFEKKGEGAVCSVEAWRDAKGNLSREFATATYGPAKDGSIVAGLVPSDPYKGGQRIIQTGFSNEEDAEKWLIETSRKWAASRVADYCGKKYLPNFLKFAVNSKLQISEIVEK